jgi:hypothetical protein
MKLNSNNPEGYIYTDTGGLLAVLENFPQRLVHFQSSIVVVVNESLPPEPIHEQIDSRARGADRPPPKLGD